MCFIIFLFQYPGAIVAVPVSAVKDPALKDVKLDAVLLVEVS